MSSAQRAAIVAAILLSAAPRAFAGDAAPAASHISVVRAQSACGPGCECSECAGGAFWGLAGKLHHLIDLCCLKHRCFRQMFPYHSCYKPCPPYLMENKGYNTTCWRRLPESFRPCPPVIEGFPVEIQPLTPLDVEPAEIVPSPEKAGSQPPPPVPAE